MKSSWLILRLAGICCVKALQHSLLCQHTFKFASNREYIKITSSKIYRTRLDPPKKIKSPTRAGDFTF